jgi:hypothetical protein
MDVADHAMSSLDSKDFTHPRGGKYCTHNAKKIDMTQDEGIFVGMIF